MKASILYFRPILRNGLSSRFSAAIFTNSSREVLFILSISAAEGPPAGSPRTFPARPSSSSLTRLSAMLIDFETSNKRTSVPWEEPTRLNSRKAPVVTKRTTSAPSDLSVASVRLRRMET